MVLSNQEVKKIFLILGVVLLVFIVGISLPENRLEISSTGQAYQPTTSGALNVINNYKIVRGEGTCDDICKPNYCFPVMEECTEEIKDNYCYCVEIPK
jgi:hypothetical protein